jgi:hypothetical protein
MLVQGDEYARLEGGGMLRQNTNDHLPERIRQNVLGPHLHDTRTARTSGEDGRPRRRQVYVDQNLH